LSIQQLSAVEFRQKLAGLVDPGKVLPDMELQVIKDEAVKLCRILVEVFSDSLDRKTLWDRIGNGLAVSSIKCGGDWELLLEKLLEYIRAEPGKVAANSKIDAWMETMALRPKEWRDQFIRTCETKRMSIIVKARQIWNLDKMKEATHEPGEDL
jgi:hypothetical protein